MRYSRILFSAGAAFSLLSCTDATATEDLVPVAISVSISDLKLVLGETAVLRAWLVNSEGRGVNGAPLWSSSDAGVATIGAISGIVSTIAVGTATMTASFGDLSAATIVTVRPPAPPVTLTLSKPTSAIVVGGFDILSAVARDSTGRVASARVEWSSADPAVATIGKTDGILLGVTVGTTAVTATAGQLSASVAVSVIAVSGSLSVARWTWGLGGGNWASDVISFSTNSTQLLPVKRDARFASIAAPSWSADGSSLAIEVIHAFDYDDYSHEVDYWSDVYILQGASLDTSKWRPLTTDGLSKAPSWSPNGERIAYLRQSAPFSGNDIYVINVVGGQPVRVTATTGGYSAPHWSPDGTRLVFSAFDEQLLNSDVFTVRPDGSGLTNVSRHSSEDYDPSWSPDGRQLVFVSWRDASVGTPSAAVYVMDVDGANVRRLTSRNDYSSRPAWSPDGRQLAFLAGGALFIMNADGSSQAQLTQPPSGSWDTSPTWRRLQ